MHITVIGTGYVGLVSGTCFAEFGYHVTCVDTDPQKIAILQGGGVPIYEPGLDLMIARNVKDGRLKFSTDLAASLKGANLIFLAVGTPTDPATGKADLQYIYQAAQDVALNVTGHAQVVIKSTVPVGTNRHVQELMANANPKATFEIISNPEFLREGQALEDFMNPDRVIVGCTSDMARQTMAKLYRPLTLMNIPVFYTGLESAELMKYSANAFLALKISFINEIADISEQCGANIQDIAHGIGLDHRIGPKFLQTSPGYGGSCFPKDTLALRESAAAMGAPTSIVDAVIKSNDHRKKSMADRIIKACGKSVEGKTIAILGLTFKPETDDMRDAVSLDIIPTLQKSGAQIIAYDPTIENSKEHMAQNLLKDVTFANSAYDCLEGADALVILTEWNIFRGLDLSRVKDLLKQPLIIDLRNIYTPEEMADAGFTYHSLGRPTIFQPLSLHESAKA